MDIQIRRGEAAVASWFKTLPVLPQYAWRFRRLLRVQAPTSMLFVSSIARWYDTQINFLELQSVCFADTIILSSVHLCARPHSTYTDSGTCTIYVVCHHLSLNSRPRLNLQRKTVRLEFAYCCASLPLPKYLLSDLAGCAGDALKSFNMLGFFYSAGQNNIIVQNGIPSQGHIVPSLMLGGSIFDLLV